MRVALDRVGERDQHRIVGGRIGEVIDVGPIASSRARRSSARKAGIVGDVVHAPREGVERRDRLPLRAAAGRGSPRRSCAPRGA